MRSSITNSTAFILPQPWFRLHEWVGVVSLGVGLHFAWVLWGRDNPWEQLWLGHLILLIPLVIVLGITWQVAGNGRTAWRWLALGLTVRACGDGIRWFIVTAQGGYPFVLNSLGLIYGLAALFTAWGLGQYGHPLRTPVSRVRLIVDAFLTSTASLALLWLLIFRAALNSSVVREEMVLWLGLQINWLPILVVLIRLVMAEIRSFPAALGLWGLGWLILALNDQAFFALWQRNAYFVGAPLDVAYNFGLLILGAGALLSIPGVTSISTRGQRGWRYAGLRLQNLFPLLLTLLLGWTVLIQYQLQGRVDLLGLWVTLWLTLGLIARQGLIIGETEFRQYAGLVYSIAEPAFICDRRGVLRLVNPAFCRAVGVDDEQHVLGTPLLKWFVPEDHLVDWISLTLEGEGGVAWSGETELLTRDGQRIPVFLSLRRILPIERERLALAGTAHDLSHQKAQHAALQAALRQIEADRAQLERLNADLERLVAEKTADLSAAYARLEAQNRALRELDRLKSDFVSLVSHELRAPLTNIKGGLELVLSKPTRLPVRTREHLLLVQAEIERLSRFVETILDLSALEAGRLPLYPAPLDLETVVGRLQRQFVHHPQMERLVWEISPALPPVLADEQALSSILFHLIDNALKYAPQGEVRITARVQANRLLIQVLDEGPGLPEEALPLLFQPFYRVATSDAQETYGHGLGLYIVRRLAEAMGGQVWAENRLQGGACFSCALPLTEVESLDGEQGMFSAEDGHEA